METKARLGLMLPGAVSLGAYEGGALAAMLTAVQAAKGGIVIDAIASASAGSITALVACRALLQGADPVQLMQETWVKLPAYERLRTSSLVSPLSMDKLREAAKKILGESLVPSGGAEVYCQAEPVRLSMAVTALGGLNYRIVSLRPPGDHRKVAEVYGSTYTDWFNRTLPPDRARRANTADFLALVEEALASGATPLGFPPMFMDRAGDAEALQQYERSGVYNPPEDGRTNWSLWCSDGGDLDNEPFGRLLDLIDDSSHDDHAKRALVLLDTRPTVPTGWVGKWFSGDPHPSWTSTLLRVGKVRQVQSYYEDLRRLEKTNSRLRWVGEVATQLEHALRQLPGEAGEQARKAVDAALAEANRRIEADKHELRAELRPGQQTLPSTAATPTPTPTPERPTLRDVLMNAAGLAAKNEVAVEIIAPDHPLSGDFLFNFGGFIEEKLRQNDFAVGYRNAQAWLQGWLRRQGLGDATTDAVLNEVARRYATLPGKDLNLRDTTLWKLSPAQRLQVARVAMHAFFVVQRGLISDFFQRRRARRAAENPARR